jgi:hypothetical protein
LPTCSSCLQQNGPLQPFAQVSLTSPFTRGRSHRWSSHANCRSS